MERFTPVLTFFACCITAAISNKITPEGGFAAVIWPPLGIGIAGLMIETRKTSIAIFLAALLFSFRSSLPWSSIIPIALADTASAILGARILKQTPNLDWTFTKTDQVGRFILRIVMPVAAITPLVGAPLIIRTYSATFREFSEYLVTWWLGNAVAILIFTPFILIVSRDHLYAPFKKRLPEFYFLSALTVLTCAYLFVDVPSVVDFLPNVVRRIYLLFPLILWSAIRFGPVGTAFLLQGVAAFATYGAVNGAAVFSGKNTPETFNSVQLYLGFLAATGFMVSAHVTESHRNERRFRSMFELAGVPSALVSHDGRFKLVNDQFCKMTGYTREELLQKTFGDITHPDDRNENLKLFKKLIAGEKKSIHVEKRYIIKSGEIIWSLIDATLINHLAPQDTTSIAIVQDITARKIAEIAASKAKRDAEEASQAKTEFLAFMSHEIRTPLGVILGFAEILREKSLDQSLRNDFAETIHRNAVELSQLIDDVLDLSKIEAGRVERKVEQVNIVDLIRDLKETFSLEAHQKNLQLEFVLEEDTPQAITSDHKILRQILINIIGNAIKYTDRGTITVDTKIQTQHGDHPNSAVFSVSDTGCGIAPYERKKLFKPFGQANSQPTKKNKSTGLGLVLSKRLAQLLGGDVELKNSKVGVGSTFVITVDAGSICRKQKEPIRHQPTGLAAAEVNGKELEKTRILVAEDTPDQAMLIKFLLLDAGASVTVVNNGAGAVEKSMEENFDVVLMDMQMPIMNGIDATRQLRRQGYGKAIIALTAKALKSDADRAIEAGCDHHLSKPFTQERLVQIIKDTLKKLPHQSELIDS